MDPSVFEALEPPEPVYVDRSIRGIVRNFRPRFIKGTITTHNGFIRPTVKFPWGFSWRMVDGIDYCPYCYSAAPHSMLALMMTRTAWSPISSAMEIRDLIERGEMAEGEESMHRAMHPPIGCAYATYVFEGGVPRHFTIVDGERGPISMWIDHVLDLHPVPRAALISHMNRLSTSVCWSVDEDGDLSWAPLVPAFIAQPGLDDEDDEETPHDPSSN